MTILIFQISIVSDTTKGVTLIEEVDNILMLKPAFAAFVLTSAA